MDDLDFALLPDHSEILLLAPVIFFTVKIQLKIFVSPVSNHMKQILANFYFTTIGCFSHCLKSLNSCVIVKKERALKITNIFKL